MATLEQIQEIANRGLQDRLPPEKRQRFDEMVRRGTITLAPTEQPQPERSTLEQGVGALETGAAIASGIVAEPIAGIAGAITAPFVGAEQATQNIEATREALTFQPRTEAGQEQVQAVGEFVEPVGKAIQAGEKFLGDKTFELTGSPALAAAAATIPTAISELIGIAGAKGVLKAKRTSKEGKIAQEIGEAIPTIDQLKDTSRAVYKELDDAGVTIKPERFRALVSKMTVESRRAGLDPNITPKANQALNRFRDEVGNTLSLTELDTLRKVAQNAAKSLEPVEAALGSRMIDMVDEFLDKATPGSFISPEGTARDISKRYKVARELWGRARRSELMQEAFEKARNQASGFENGIRTQFRSILNNKRQRRFFNKQELEAIQKVVRGGRGENIAKFIGRFGFTEGGATNIIGGALGATAGGVAFGAPGAVIVPLIGQLSRKLAQRLTARNAQFADEVIRAGKDANKITRAYFKNTPKAQRSPEELSQLLQKADIDLSDVGVDEIARQAAVIASENRLAVAAGAGTGATIQQGSEIPIN